ncbi:unnamed protein product, partial [Amoebophrya sp. A120]
RLSVERKVSAYDITAAAGLTPLDTMENPFIDLSNPRRGLPRSKSESAIGRLSDLNRGSSSGEKMRLS